jgi:hypothetical protein
VLFVFLFFSFFPPHFFLFLCSLKAAELAKKRKNPAEVIDKKLSERPSARDLQEKNILKTDSNGPAPKIQLESKLKLVAKK